MKIDFFNWIKKTPNYKRFQTFQLADIQQEVTRAGEIVWLRSIFHPSITTRRLKGPNCGQKWWFDGFERKSTLFSSQFIYFSVSVSNIKVCVCFSCYTSIVIEHLLLEHGRWIFSVWIFYLNFKWLFLEYASHFSSRLLHVRMVKPNIQFFSLHQEK